MRFNKNLGAAALGVLIVLATLPALAAGKHFARAERMQTHGVIVTGPAWVACNGDRTAPIQQCMSKAKA